MKLSYLLLHNLYQIGFIFPEASLLFSFVRVVEYQGEPPFLANPTLFMFMSHHLPLAWLVSHLKPMTVESREHACSLVLLDTDNFLVMYVTLPLQDISQHHRVKHHLVAGRLVLLLEHFFETSEVYDAQLAEVAFFCVHSFENELLTLVVQARVLTQVDAHQRATPSKGLCNFLKDPF